MNQKKVVGLMGLGSLLVIIGILFLVPFSKAQPLENDVRVAENSSLTYYLNIYYDGKDQSLVSSSDTLTASVYSDTIYVEDKLPEGLTFKQFVNSADGTIGAVKRSDLTTSCSGQVVNGYEGLHHDTETNTVSFQIKGLQAGCQVTVGITVQTPSLEDETRKDFYNTAFGREGESATSSNTVHVYMGNDDETLYSVKYEYTGVIPENAPKLPDTLSYASGTVVGVMNDVEVAGYTFSGWKSEEVSVESGTFSMPDQEVIFRGSFTKNPEYTVSYEIDGEKPDDYLPPRTKSYGVGEEVTLDNLKEGDIYSGYRFLGWEKDGVKVTEDTFVMGSENVTFVGKFERIRYEVSYQFQGSTIPEESESLLPGKQTYYPGEKVTVAEYPEIEGYRFLGWYSEKEFTMPEENVVIYGEWMKIDGTFAPTIEKRITNPKASYQEGEKVNFEIIVTNPAEFEIQDIRIEERNEKSIFLAGVGYTVLNNQQVKIDKLGSQQSITILAEYEVGKDKLVTITNTVELTGALAENNYYLDTSKKYESRVSFEVSNIYLQIEKVNESGELLEGANFGMYEDVACSNLIQEGLRFGSLERNQTYYLKEIQAPEGYQINSQVLEVRVKENGEIEIPGYEVDNSQEEAKVSMINYRVTVESPESPNTLDNVKNSMLAIILSLGVIIAGGILFIILGRKKKK